MVSPEGGCWFHPHFRLGASGNSENHKVGKEGAEATGGVSISIITEP